MKQQAPIFSQLLFTQVLANVGGSLQRFHQSNNQCFDAILATPQKDLLLYSPGAYNDKPLLLPILESLPLLPEAKKDRFSLTPITPLKTTLSNFFSTSKTSEKLFESTYFSPSFIKSISKAPFKSFQQFSKSKLPHDIQPVLNTIRITLEHLIQTFPSTSFWSTNEHYRYLKRFLSKVTLLQQSMTIDTADTYLSLIPTILHHLNESTQRVYGLDSDNPESFSDDFYLWNTHLENYILLFKAISESFLFITLFKLHFHQLLLQTLSLNKKDHSLDNLNQLLSDNQTKYVYQLCYQQGLLYDISNQFKNLSRTHSNFNISDDSFSNEIKEAFFKVKNSLFEFESIIPQASSQTWVNYFQLCFSYNLSDIGIHLIANYFDVFPTYELTDAIGEAIISSVNKINTHISELPKSIQNQSNTALKIKPELYHCLYKETHALFRLLFWSAILTCHLCLTGRYSLIPNCLIKIYSALSNVDFSNYYLNFVAVIFNPKIFHHHLDFLTQIHPESLLEIIDSAIILYPTDPTITLQNHSSLNPWFNSPNFINRWVSLFRSQLFLHPHEGWTALYPFMTYPFLSRSYLIETWIDFAPTHTLERNCLTRMIHSIARTSPDDLRLFFLYIRTKHISLELPELTKIKLSFSLTESTLKDFISHIKFLYESNYSENLYAITLITQQLLDYCESLHATYSCDVTSYLINEHLSSLLFILTINLKHKLATCYPLIQFIGIYYILDSQIYHTIHQSQSEIFSSIEKTPETLELLHRTHKTTPELSQLFLALLVRYFSTPSTSEDYALDLDEANTTSLKKQSSRNFDRNTSAMDPFYLLHDITQFLLEAFPIRLDGDTQSYEFVEIKTTIESWLKRNRSFLLLYLDKTIGLSLETLIQHALNGNGPRFLNQRNHLRSLIFSLQSLSFLQKLILSHTLNLCSLLLDTPSHSRYFCSLSLFLFNFKSISSKSFIFFCLQMFHNDYKTATGLNEFNISTFQEIFAQYKHLNTNFDDVDFIFLEHSLSTLQTLFLLIPEYETTQQQQLFSLFNIILDYYEIIPEDSAFLKGFIYKTLPILNSFFESGFINYFHPFFNAILSYHHTESNPNEDLEKAYLYIKDYQLIHNCLNLNNPINFNLFEALLEKPYIQTSLTHIFTESPGMCLHFSLFLLTHSETLSPESHDHGISQFLNHIFNQSLSLQQWKNARFFFYLLTVFYNYSSTTQPLDHMIELSVKEHDKAIISSLLLKTPQQAKQLILRLQDVSQSAHPIIKNILLSLLDYTIKNQLSDPYLTIKSIENKSLKECLIIKSEIDQNISHALTQLHRLITTVAYAPLQESILESFILKALIYLKQFSTSISFLPTIDHESENYLDQLLGIILCIDIISTTLTDLNPELFQDINRHLCQIIAKIILEPRYGGCLNAQRLDFLFATHHQLLLDELKTLIIDSQTLSFQQVQNLLALLSNAPEQLTYNRFSEWFIYLDVLKFMQDDDITLVLFECCLAHPRLVIDSIQNHQNPKYYFQILADESPSLAFYLLNTLVQSSLESDLNLVTECQQIISNNPILSYLVSSKKSSYFIDDLIQYAYSTESIPINKRRNLITNLLPKYPDSFAFFLELLFLQNKDLFWTLCHDETLGLFDSIIELTHDTPATIFSTNFLYHCFTHPMFLAYLPDISERSRYHSVSPLLIHASTLKDPASVNNFSCNDLIGWINTCYLFNQLDTCFDLLHTRDHYSVDCFYEMFFNHMAQKDISYNTEIFLNYLCKCTDLSLKSFITHLNDHYAITYHDFAVFLLNAVSKSVTPHTYTQLQIRCTPYLSQLTHIHAQFSISESATYMISIASVCHIQELSIGDICQFLKECNYIPSAINPNHLTLLADAIFNESHHHFLTDLSLHYPNLFETLLFKPPFATAIQQAIFYEELHPESLLYNHIINAIDRLSYNQLLQFLGVYVQKHFTSQKHQKSVELLTSFIPFSSENVRNNFDYLETQLLTLVNTPIPRVGSNDPIIQLIFQSLPKLRQQLDITEQLYCFLSTDTATLSHHGIDFIHVKKHLELCCSSVDNRMKLLHYCQHHHDERSFHIFSRFIDHWEEKNSLFDTFNLYLTKGHEHHIFHDYLLAMATRVTYFSFENFKLNRFKKLCVAIHFLLVYSPEKLHLQHWFIHYLIPNLKAAYFNYVAAIFSSNLIDQSILKDLAIGFITHQKTACYSSLFKASFFQPFFRDVWEHFIASSKEHIILSDLLVESSPLHQSVELFMRNFIEKSPQNFFDFCTIHYNHKIYIDIFFKKLYSYYFNQTIIDTSSISMSQDNPLIGLTQTAITAQETGFLFFLARCVENHLIPNQKNVSWIIKCLNKTYRLSFSTLPHSIDSSLQNTIKKLFLSSGLLTDSGEFLEELPSLSLEQFKENNPTLTMSPAMEFAYVNLHQAAIAHFHQRNHFFTCFLSEAPTFFIQNTPATSHLGSDASSQFFEKAPAYIDYLFYRLHKNNQGTLAFKEFSSLISQNNILKPLFFNYLKCLPSNQLLPILKHPSLTLQFRHFVLFGILYDEKESNKILDNTSWETRVVHSLFKDLSLAWLSKSDTDSPHIHIEILLFFFIHFPSAIKSHCHEYYSSILESTGINFPKLFYGVNHIEMILSQPRYVVLTLDLFLEIIENLFATGFSLFDCIFCFKASSYYDSLIEHEWLSTVLKKEPMTTHSITPNWMHIIYELICTDQKIIYVPDSFFETTVYHHAFKKWLITEGHLTSKNCLTLLTYQDFLSFYNPSEIYSELMATVSTMVSAKPLQPQLIQSIAESFFESIFYNLTPFITPASIHYHELKLVLDILPLSLPHYEKTCQLNYLKEFQSALFNYQLVSLLDIRFLDFVMALINDANHGISATKKRNLIESIPIECTLDHAIFDPLSNQQKIAFKAYLIEHHILVNDHIYYRKSELIKRTLETSKEYYESFTLLDKYILAQTTLLDSALTIIAQLGYILLYPADIARRHFIDLFGTIHDHEWVYINHLLPQTLNNQSVQDILQKFINDKSLLSKETLKKHAISLRNISSPTPEISELFDTFRKQSATLVSSPQLPTSGNLLQTLMSALSENHQNS